MPQSADASTDKGHKFAAPSMGLKDIAARKRRERAEEERRKKAKRLAFDWDDDDVPEESADDDDSKVTAPRAASKHAKTFRSKQVMDTPSHPHAVSTPLREEISERRREQNRGIHRDRKVAGADSGGKPSDGHSKSEESSGSRLKTPGSR